MTETHSSTSPAPTQARPRKIVRRTRGSHHGPITRLMSPGDLGHVLKPFDTVAWVSPGTGRVRVPEHVEAGELAIFEPSNDAIDFHAEADAEFVLGSAAPHAHDLVLGPYSVHTSSATLRGAEQRLNEIQHRLRNEGRLQDRDPF